MKLFKFNHHPNRSSAGFSLIEVLVSIALLSIMAGIGISLFAIINSSYSTANTITRIQSQGSAVFEQLERSVRSATNVEQIGCDQMAGVDECLRLTIPTDSIEYQTNGGCQYTEYTWIVPKLTPVDFGGDVGEQVVNGRMQRAFRKADGSFCGSKTNLFSQFGYDGVSVEKIDEATSIFKVTHSETSPTHVTVSVNLFDGVQDNLNQLDKRIHVPYITTVSLRDYTR